MKTTLKPAPAKGRCCETTLTLAEDFTRFTVVELAGGLWVRAIVTYDEPVDEDKGDNARLFCPKCGEYYQVPDELI